jgi:RND superfamily putative drug exporter
MLVRFVQGVLRHQRAVLAAWVLLIIVGGGLAAGLPGRIVPGGETPANSQSDRVASKLAGSSVASLFVVVETSDPANLGSAVKAVEGNVARTGGVDTVSRAEGPVLPGRGGAAVLQVSTRGSVDGSIAVAHRLNAHRSQLGPPGTRVLIGGFGAYRDQLTTLSQSDLERAERVGLPILFVVLFLTFGSLIAAVTPMVVALSSLVIGLGVVGAVAVVLPMSDFVTNASSMIGIALGVDYCMFLLRRFRTERRRGLDPEAAVLHTMATTGRAVMWSALTIVLAESSLMLVDSRSVRSAAFGMVVVSACTAVSAFTIVPIGLLRLHHRLMPIRRHALTRRHGAGWARWGRWVTRRAPLCFVAGTVALLVLTVPAWHLGRSVNISAATTLPASSSVRQAYEEAQSLYGPDAESPVVVVVHGADGTDPMIAGREVAAVVAAAPQAAAVETIALPDRAAAVVITSKFGAYDAATRSLVTSLRQGELHDRLANVSYAVGGETAMAMDATGAMFGGLLWVVVALALVIAALLALAMRSVLLPAKAIVLVAFSVASSMGALLLFTGTSLGARIIGAGGPEDLHPIVPVTILAIIVALSTDYEVILLSRVAEGWERDGDNRASIVEGIADTGGIITGAAAVMIAVFVGFGIAALQPLKQLGVGLALAVFIDATVVRAVLVPAAMTLMGRWNWWRPGQKTPATRPSARDCERFTATPSRR